MSVITTSGISALKERERRARRDRKTDPLNNARNIRRGMSPDVLERVAMLPARDRAILELTLSAKLSRSHIGRALGMSPGLVSRRIRMLYARVHDPMVAALFDPRCPLAPEYRQLGIEHFLLGASMNQLADKHRLPFPHVRRIIIFLRGWHKGATGPRR